MSSPSRAQTLWLAALVLIGALFLFLGQSTGPMPLFSKQATGGMVPEMGMATRSAAPMAADMAYYDAGEAAGSLALNGEAGSAQQRVMRDGWITLLVHDVDQTLNEIQTLTPALSGLVLSSSVSESPDGARTGFITIRVPEAQFDDVRARVHALGLRVTSENIQATDVTEEYTDLQTRLRVAQEEEQAYLTLLNRSGSVSDLLSVQRELASVRARIESLQGQLQYMENRTDYSTLNIQLEEDLVVKLPTKQFRPRAIFHAALQGLVLFFQWILGALIWLVVLGVGVALPIWLVVLLVRHWMHKR